MNFIISASTDIGLVKKVNQDSFTLKKAHTSIGDAVLAVICDGMGGFSSGEIASATVVTMFSDWFINAFSNYDLNNLNETVIQHAWNKITDEANTTIGIFGEKNGIRLGTTVTAILFIDYKYYCINVGDSRAYLFRNNSVYQLTKDQTLVQRELDLGNINYEESLVYPQRNVLLQCIGCCKNLKGDFYSGEYKMNDVFLLCSDGFRHEVSEIEMLERFIPCNNSNDLTYAADYLIKLNMERGETDNITALLVKAI